MLTPEQIAKRRAQQQAMMERSRAKQLAKQADPEWRASQQAKQRAAQHRAAVRAREKQQQLYRAHTIAQQDSIDDYRNDSERDQLAEKSGQIAPEIARLLPDTPKPPAKYRKTSTRGLKGRTPLADERSLADKLAALPCIACQQHGKHSPIVSLHHMHGRTSLDAHKKQLPLCTWHHQELAPASVRRRYPWLIPIHAAGIHGGKTEWQRLNGQQEDLYLMCLEQIGETP
ncbi:TPA: Ref family recombination enhancement nuclease [Enterobacter cloacae]